MEEVTKLTKEKLLYNDILDSVNSLLNYLTIFFVEDLINTLYKVLIINHKSLKFCIVCIMG